MPGTKRPGPPAGEDATAQPGVEGPETPSRHRHHATELDRHIGERLRFVRRLSCLSQRQVGDEVGLSFQQVQKFEIGASRVSAALLAELSGLFRLPMDWFIGPFNACLERDGQEPLTGFAHVLDRLYSALHDRSEGECHGALDLVCQVAGVGAGPHPTRLLRLRRTIQNGGAESQVLLLEVVRRMADGPARPAASPPHAQPGGCDVMLVDDDPDVLATISASLVSAGLTVSTASSGDEALGALAAGLHVGVMVSDYAMVGMDGVELLAQAGQMRPGLPGIIITGFAGSGRLRELPAEVEVLSKPFRRMELVGRIRLLMEGKGASAAAWRQGPAAPGHVAGRPAPGRATVWGVTPPG